MSESFYMMADKSYYRIKMLVGAKKVSSVVHSSEIIDGGHLQPSITCYMFNCMCLYYSPR